MWTDSELVLERMWENSSMRSQVKNLFFQASDLFLDVITSATSENVNHVLKSLTSHVTVERKSEKMRFVAETTLALFYVTKNYHAGINVYNCATRVNAQTLSLKEEKG